MTQAQLHFAARQCFEVERLHGTDVTPRGTKGVIAGSSKGEVGWIDRIVDSRSVHADDVGRRECSGEEEGFEVEDCANAGVVEEGCEFVEAFKSFCRYVSLIRVSLHCVKLPGLDEIRRKPTCSRLKQQRAW